MIGRLLAGGALLSLTASLVARPHHIAPRQQLDPGLRIGLGMNLPAARIGGTAGIRLLDPDEGLITILPDADSLLVSLGDTSLILRHSRLPDLTRRTLTIEPLDSGGRVTFNGRVYRGNLEVRAAASGLVVVNRVMLEEYLVGVVSAEMGVRQADELEALKAQAVAARTYALRNRGRWQEQGFDLLSDVNDQVYTGVNAENPLAAEAVAATRGEVLMYEGELIEAFYFSTCSGHTEEGRAAFGGTSRPYLRSLPDLDSTGTAWCAISPRYTWSESWTATQLGAILKRTLPANDFSDDRATDLTDLRIVDRTASRRVALLQLAGRDGRTSLTGQAIRRVLGPTSGGILRSNDFTVKLTKQGGKLVRVQINGRGNGHGVGMCQWGAIGRARAGQDYRTILTSYFPGVDLTRMYP